MSLTPQETEYLKYLEAKLHITQNLTNTQIRKHLKKLIKRSTHIIKNTTSIPRKKQAKLTIKACKDYLILKSHHPKIADKTLTKPK